MKELALEEQKKKEKEILSKHKEQIQKYAEKVNDKKKTLENSREKKVKPLPENKQTNLVSEN